MATVTLEDVRKGVNLSIRDGEFICLVGPSGCGKSTPLNLIAGLEELTSGTLKIDDVVVNTLSPGARDIAMVFQSYALYPHMDVRGSLAFPLSVAGVDARTIEERVRDTAAMLGVPLRRAPLQPGRGAAHADARRNQEAPREAGRDVHLRHPRPGRGHDALGPGGGDEPGRGAPPTPALARNRAPMPPMLPRGHLGAEYVTGPSVDWPPASSAPTEEPPSFLLPQAGAEERSVTRPQAGAEEASVAPDAGAWPLLCGPRGNRR